MIELAKFILETFKPKKVVEVGIGNYLDVALMLSKYCKVVATDVRKISVPKDIKFYIDDIMNPHIKIYEDADLIYSIRPSVSLLPYIAKVARRVKANMLILPLKTDYFDINLGFRYTYLINFKKLHFYLFSNKELNLPDHVIVSKFNNRVLQM